MRFIPTVSIICALVALGRTDRFDGHRGDDHPHHRHLHDFHAFKHDRVHRHAHPDQQQFADFQQGPSNDAVNNDFRWQTIGGPQSQQLYLPLNNANAVNWLAYLNPATLAQLQQAGQIQQQQQQQQQPDDVFKNFDKIFPAGNNDPFFNQPFPSSGRGTSRIQQQQQQLLQQQFLQQQWLQHLQTLQPGALNSSFGPSSPTSIFGIPPPTSGISSQPPSVPFRPPGASNIQRPHKPPPSVIPQTPPATVPKVVSDNPEPAHPPSEAAEAVNTPPPVEQSTPPVEQPTPPSPTTTQAPSSTTTDAPLECEKAGDGCYAFVKTPMRFADAATYCTAHGMYLASISETNADVINRLVRDNLSSNDTSKSRPCYDRIVMLANYEAARSMRYGTYAFTNGGGDECGAGGADASSSDAPLFDVCGKDYDCSLVDWNQPRPFVCAKDDQYKPWCMRKMKSDNFYEYFVTCDSIPGDINELKYPPLCQPFEYGSDVQIMLSVQKFLNKKELALLGNIIIPQIGVIKFCIPDVGCEAPSYKDNQYGLCRKEKGIEKTTDRVQLWPNGIIPYRFSGWGSNSKNVTQVKDTMKLIQSSSQACFKFEEADPGKNYSGIVEIIPGKQPNACATEATGRKSGVQSVIYGGDCFNAKKPGLIMRLLLHTIGVPAEHTRFDRNDYVNVNTENFLADPSILRQTEKQSIPGIISLNSPYDYDSVTHFPPTALAKQKGLITFASKKPGSPELGQRTHLSDGDKRKIQLLYKECR